MLGQRVLITALACLAVVAAASSPLREQPLAFEDGDQVAEPFADDDVLNYRLPNNTRPISYDIHLTSHIHTQTDFTFTGEVKIRLTAVTASNTITLHQRQLTIGTATLVRANSPEQIPINAPTYNNVTEFLEYTLTTGNLIVNEEYILTIQYTGIHRSDVAGFYRSSYIAADGNRRWLATSHFEQTDARHGFPCYDEPALRSVFTVRITHGSIYHALSNMPIVDKTENTATGYTTTSFAQTPTTVPTYLMAFIVSDFGSKTRNSSSGLVHQVFARPTGIQDGDYALDMGIKTLDVFGKYFEIDFTFPKLDQIGLPDFPIGAMENWGLVTYREDRLLYNTQVSTFINQRQIATVIVHELSHQWFGNLVTPIWWSYNWMKEGFATLYENVATDWLIPEWKIVDTFVFAFTQTVMVSDSLNTTRPMTRYVQTPSDLSRQFDSIAYSKAGCVLFMFMNAFTENSFKRGLIDYLNTHANLYATEQNLFDAIEKSVKADQTLAAQHSVNTIFASWTRQAGYPVVSVERNYANGEITLHQSRYLAVNESTESPSIWSIPYNTASASDADFDKTAATGWFSERTATVKEDTLKSGDWFLLNKRQTGYYRVKYDLQNYKLLSDALVANHSQIHLTSRSQLIDDAFDMARTQRLSYDVAFDFTKYLQHEVEYVPWASAFRGLDYVERLYAGNSEYQRFANYLVKQLTHLYEEAGLVPKPNEHHYRKQARNQAIQMSCRLGSTSCLTETGSAVNDYLVNNVAIHQDHRATILCNGLRNANETQYNQLTTKLQNEADEIERTRFIDALACISNADLINKYLNATIVAESAIFKAVTDRYRAFSQVAGNSQASAKVANQFLAANLDSVNTQWGSSNANNAVLRLASFVVSDERTKEFNDLLTIAQSMDFINAATISSAQATVQANKAWIERNEKVVNEWIRKNGSAHLAASTILLAVLLMVSQMF